jgi:hypothetical protein
MPKLEKLDLKKELKHLYLPSAKEVVLEDVPPMTYLMMDGVIPEGMEPGNAPEFQQAFGALYGCAYTLKFMSKLKLGRDYTVMALEGLWWNRDDGRFEMGAKAAWRWTLMILQPEHITQAHFEEARTQVREKKDPPGLDKVRLERFHEGLCVQTMHIGPYAEEAATIEKMHAFARERGYVMRGKHHEIYMGDPRRTAPEKLRTVLRQPVAKAG